MISKKLLLIVTGSISAYKVCELISTLKQESWEIKVVASQAALQFVGKATLEGLSGNPVFTEIWEAGRMMEHIHLNRWADAILVAPATANFINKTAYGIADSLETNIFLAHDFTKPFIVAPAMNQAMYKHPTTTTSLKKLSEMGIQLLSPSAGHLACGEVGEGRLLEAKELIAALKKSLSPVTAQNAKRVLITAGGTSEPIDEVRILTNRSTGGTAAAIADSFSQAGWNVTYLCATSAVRPNLPCKQIEFFSFADLQTALESELKNHYDAVIHAAAVGDYRIEKNVGKLSGSQDLNLRLTPTPKLVQSIKHQSVNKNLNLVSFKLTASLDPTARELAAKNLLQSSRSDLVVQNDTHEIQWGSDQHLFHLFSSKVEKLVSGKTALGIALTKFLDSEGELR